MLLSNDSLPSELSNLTNFPSDGYEDYTTKKTMIFTILVLLSIMIISVNSFVLYLISTRRSLRTATNICLASLSCSDLLAGAVAIPLVISCTVQNTGLNSVCLVMDLLSRFQAISTVLHMLVVSLERYFTIVRRLKIDGVVRVKTILKVLCVLWLLSLALILIQLAWINLPLKDIQNDNYKAEKIYIIFLVGLVVVCLLVMLFVYGSVFSTLKRQNRRIKRYTPRDELTSSSSRERRNKEFRAIIILSSMIITFIIGWCGYFVVSLELDIMIIPEWMDLTIFFARYLTALINPFLYTFFKLDFRENATAVLRRFKSENLVSRDRSSRAISLGTS